MTISTHPITRLVSRGLMAASLSAAALILANACSSGDATRITAPAVQTGRIALSLVGVSSKNQAFRLRDASFTITARATGARVSVSTEDVPDRASLQLDLAPDVYEVYLEPGYYLELVGAGVPVAGAELISANPGMVTIAVDATSTLRLVFRVGGATLETGQGLLDIGLEVRDDEGDSDAGSAGEGEGDQCLSDAYEPNTDEPAPITPGVQVSATMCGADVYDIYTFSAPVTESEGFSVRLRHDPSMGYIFASLLDARAVDVGLIEESDDGVIVSTFSPSDRFELWVEGLREAPVGAYTIDIGECESCRNDSAVSDGCTPSDVPGVMDEALHRCVCLGDPLCCTESFDELCVVQAIACGAECPAAEPESDCCSASLVPGCGVRAVEACVCDIDPFCCANGFDDNCAQLAQDQCGATCPE